MAALIGRFLGLIIGSHVVMAAAAGAGADNLLLETGDNLLLETGDLLLLE